MNPNISQFWRRICRQINMVYENCLIHQTLNRFRGPLGRFLSRFHPKSDAENIIQLDLKAGLSTPFTGCVVSP